MGEHWWRAYDGAVDNPKLLLLSDRTHRAWFNLMCLASANGGRLPERKVIELKLRLSPAKTSEVLRELIDAGLIDEDETGFTPHDWNERQYKSDVSTTRVKRFRERQRNVSETSPEYREQITEKKKEREEARASRGACLPDDWRPSAEDFEYGQKLGLSVDRIHEAAEEMRLWAGANKNRSVARKADWSLTFRAWLRRNCKGKSNGTTAPNRLSHALSDLKSHVREIDGGETSGVPPAGLLSDGRRQ